MPPLMVEWSGGLITRYVKGQTGRTAYREARGHDPQAPVAEFGEMIMYMTSTAGGRRKLMRRSTTEYGWVDHRDVEWSDQSEDCEEAPRGSEVVRGGSAEHTRNTVKSPCQVWEVTTSHLRPTGQGMLDAEKTSTHQHKIVRSVTLAQQLPHQTRH